MSIKRFIFFFLFLCISTLLTAQPTFWTWCGYDESRDWHGYFQELQDVGVTGVLLGAPKEGLEKVIPIADSYGIEVYAWLWIMNNASIAKEHPEWLDYNQRGESIRDKKAYVDYYQFLNPAIPEVQEAIVAQVEEIAAIKGLKGISLDYCRYVDAILPTTLWKNYDVVQDKVYPEWDYGYHPQMIKAFISKYGYDPCQQEDINGDKTWHQFRMDKVNEVVDKLVMVAEQYNVEISASPFPTPEMSRRMVYQDWGKWKLDRAFPMIYDSFYTGNLEWIANCIIDCRRDMAPDAHLYFGLYVPGYITHRDFTIFDAMQTALDNGAEGVSFFTFSDLSKEDKEALKQFIKKANEKLLKD